MTRHDAAWVALLMLSAAGCSDGKPSSATTGAGGSGGTAGSGAAGTSPTGTGGSGGGAPAPPEVTRLGFFPMGVSGDGSVVVGRGFQEQTRALRWTAATGAVSSAALNDFDVRGISADASTIIGNSIDSTGQMRAVRVVGDTRTQIPLPRSTDTNSQVVSVNGDGTVIAGTTWSTNPIFTSSQGFRWTTAGGTEGLGFLPGDEASEIAAVSPDGATIVGLSYDLDQRKARPFRWTKATGMIELPPLATSSLTLPVAVNDAGTVIGDAFGGGQVEFASVSAATSRDAILWMQGPPKVISGCPAGMNSASAIAADGTALVSCSGVKVLRASPTGETRLLAPPPPPPGFFAGDQSLSAAMVSSDGTVVVGRYDLGSLGGTANYLAIWTGTSTQPAVVTQKLTGMPGAVELPNPVAMALSADASTVVGMADGPDGWLLRLR